MNEELEMLREMASEAMQKSIERFQQELTKIRAGKAHPSMLDRVSVDYYGNSTPLSQVANINTPDGKTITIQPWEKGIMQEIEKAIINSNLGLNPQNNGDIIIISLPTLTEQRRTELVKMARTEAENSKVGIRNARRDANDAIKKLQKRGFTGRCFKKK